MQYKDQSTAPTREPFQVKRIPDPVQQQSRQDPSRGKPQPRG